MVARTRGSSNFIVMCSAFQRQKHNGTEASSISLFESQSSL